MTETVTDTNDQTSLPISDDATYEHRGIVRLVVRWLVRLYYPRIEIEGATQVNRTGPVLLCANHANSLLDPVLIGIAVGRPVRFMAKAPLFDHPVLGPPMNALGMIPAFRASDDKKQVKRNLESLGVGANVLKNGHAMGIFPEGVSTDQSHLEVIKSGAARMAIQAAEEGARDVQVVPLALIYQRKDRFRSSVWIRIAEPIEVDELLKEHDNNVRKARRSLTNELQVRLQEVVVHLDEPKWENWLGDLEILLPPNNPSRKPSVYLSHRDRIANAMNHFLKTDEPRAEAIAKEIDEYRLNVESAGLRIDSLVLRSTALRVLGVLVRDVVLLVALLLPAICGTLYHIIPFLLVRFIAGRMDQPGRQTVSTNRMLVGAPIYFLWYVAVVVGLLYLRMSWAAGGLLVLAPFFGVVSMFYWRQARSTVSLIQHQFLALIKKDRLNDLKAQLSRLTTVLAEVSTDYGAALSKTETDQSHSSSEG
jgi:1-acyl-sn-glycerol-3-phosphate acyltransferase